MVLTCVRRKGCLVTMLSAGCLLLAPGVALARPAYTCEPEVQNLEDWACDAIEYAARQLAGADPADMQEAFSACVSWSGLCRVAAGVVVNARNDKGPRETAAAIVEAADLNCDELLLYAAVALFVDTFIDGVYINIPYIELIADVLVAVTLLCYLGIV